MITLSKKLALAVSLLALSSWQFVAFGSEPNHAADQRNKPQVVVIPMELEAPKRDMVTMHQTPKEIWKKIPLCWSHVLLISTNREQGQKN